MVASYAHARNLPLQATSFIGRDQELIELGGGLRNARLLTLTGVGGVGKTRLALALAERVAESYPDGTTFVDLAPLANAGLVAQTVATVESVPLAPGDDPVSALVAYFRARRALLILDNCEHVLADCSALAGAMLRHCAHLTIVATSREPLGVAGELRWRVPPLAAPADASVQPSELLGYAAVQLLVARAQSALPHFALTSDNAQTVARICTRLDGIPLALELAAARAGTIPLDAIADRLDDRFRLLTRGDRAAVPRQQTLAATVEWSHELLTDDERQLFRRLSVFAGAWTLEAAERICGPEHSANWEILDVLSRLVDKSMVVAEIGTS